MIIRACGAKYRRSHPNFKAQLVFRPEWLRQTRFGEILYKGDLLLKELSEGVPLLGATELRAGGSLATFPHRRAASQVTFALYLRTVSAKHYTAMALQSLMVRFSFIAS